MLSAFLWRNKWSYIISALSILAAQIVTVQFPNLIGRFTNALKAGQMTYSLVVHYSLLLVIVGAGYVILFGIGQFRNGQVGRRFEYLLRRRLFSHWETLSTSYFRERSIGDLLNHAMNDVRTVREAMSGGANQLSNAVFLLCSALFMTFKTVSVKLTLVSMIPILFVPLFVIWWGPRIRNASRRVQEGLSDMADLTEESLSAIRLIKATANEQVERERFTKRVDGIVSRQMTMFKQSALFQSMIPLMGSLSFSIALLYGGYMTVTGQIQLGAFVAFTLYLGMIITPLQQFGFVINNFQRASASLVRLKVLFAEEPDIRDEGQVVSVDNIRGDIEVHLDAFQYADGDHPALKDISFSVHRGQTLGIVGRTGSGKTTLVNLLPRIFNPPRGSVFIDGRDVRDLRLADLREAIAYVPQDGFLFSTTIGENIAFSKLKVSQQEIEQAAKDACIYDDVVGFKDGFQTVIGERGVALSGGQKQRTAIARAFIKNAPILILDDSLSAVDMGTEKRIIETLSRVRDNQTTIIIAHRLSAVRHADLIIVLDDSKLVEQGTHESLLAQGGIYSAMHALQEESEVTTA